MNLTCNFQDDFMCGYKVSRAGSASWERYHGEGPNPATSPKADNDGISTGKCWQCCENVSFSFCTVSEMGLLIC